MKHVNYGLHSLGPNFFSPAPSTLTLLDISRIHPFDFEKGYILFS